MLPVPHLCPITMKETDFMKWLKRSVFLLLFPLAAAVAQKPAAPALKPRTDTVAISTTEQVALGFLAEKFQANVKDRDELLASVPSSIADKIKKNESDRDNLLAAVRAVEAAIAAEHPGYHFDEATSSIVKDVKPEPAKDAAAAAVAKASDVKPEVK